VVPTYHHHHHHYLVSYLYYPICHWIEEGVVGWTISSMMMMIDHDAGNG